MQSHAHAAVRGGTHALKMQASVHRSAGGVAAVSASKAAAAARHCRNHWDVAARAAAAEAPSAPPPSTAPLADGGVAFSFACPICTTNDFAVSSRNPYQACRCGRCGRTFESTGKYLDLTLTSGVTARAYQQKSWQGTELFRQPLVSFAYERGWRQNFAGAGFPGPEREAEIALRYMTPAHGGVLVDVSCGTGLFTRVFARSGAFSGVVALDYSESMLLQAQQYFADDPGLGASAPIVAVRADIGRLPFATGSVDVIHAGAAIHCWPNPQAAFAEISRVLRPGGVFVASTFLTPLAPLGELVGDDTVRPLSQVLNPFGSSNRTFRYWEEPELVDLVNSVGLQGYTRTRERMFIMFTATKPALPPAGKA